jgi:hypothetical protein
MFRINYGPDITFTKTAYPHYKTIHNVVTDTLTDHSMIKTTNNRVMYWPFVTLNEKHITKLTNNPDIFIGEIIRYGKY